MDPVYWIAIACMIASFGLGVFYVWLRGEVPHRNDDDPQEKKKR